MDRLSTAVAGTGTGTGQGWRRRSLLGAAAPGLPALARGAALGLPALARGAALGLPALARAEAPGLLDRRRLTLTFADEFDSFSLWRPGRGGRWMTSFKVNQTLQDSRTLTSNGELQIYVDPDYTGTVGQQPLGLNPFSIRDGVLFIEANRTPPALRPQLWDKPYTSGLITSRFSFAQRYGYFEIRTRLPRGLGFWPAFWLLPTNNAWPPEIDVFEHHGKTPARMHLGYVARGKRPDGTIGRTGEGGWVDVPDATAGFHTYGVSWQPDLLRWYFDDREVGRYPTPPTMNLPMYLLANLAIGGPWAGTPDASTPFPAYMEIDFIRAYQEAT